MAGVKHKSWLFSIKVIYQTNKKGCCGAAFFIDKFTKRYCYHSYPPGDMLLKLNMPSKDSTVFLSRM